MQEWTIGQLARQTGVSVDTIRYYERRGLLRPHRRRPTLHGPGYRLYNEDAVRRLRFIKRAQRLGFSLREIRELLELRLDPQADRREVQRRIEHKVQTIDTKIRELRRLRHALIRIRRRCQGPGPVCACPILDALESADE